MIQKTMVRLRSLDGFKCSQQCVLFLQTLSGQSAPQETDILNGSPIIYHAGVLRVGFGSGDTAELQIRVPGQVQSHKFAYKLIASNGAY